MNYYWTFLIGGGMVSLITYLSRNALPHYAGILMVFPIITILSLFLAPANSLKTISTWGLLGAVSTAIFLASFVGLNCIFGPEAKILSLWIALIAWLLVIVIAVAI